MDDEKNPEEAIEDMDVPAEEAEDVKGGLNFTSPQLKGELKLDGSVIKLNPGQFQHKGL